MFQKSVKTNEFSLLLGVFSFILGICILLSVPLAFTGKFHLGAFFVSLIIVVTFGRLFLKGCNHCQNGILRFLLDTTKNESKCIGMCQPDEGMLCKGSILTQAYLVWLSRKWFIGLVFGLIGLPLLILMHPSAQVSEFMHGQYLVALGLLWIVVYSTLNSEHDSDDSYLFKVVLVAVLAGVLQIYVSGSMSAVAAFLPGLWLLWWVNKNITQLRSVAG